jgi:hypothetical protein
MGSVGLEVTGKARLSQIIQQHEKDKDRFSDGFIETIERNFKAGKITYEESLELYEELSIRGF